MATLFNLPIHAPKPSNHISGIITCTEPAPQVYLLSFTSPPDNRLLTPFCQTLLLALDILEFSFPTGVVITTSSIPKFYSNGLELDHAKSTPGFWELTLYALFKRFLTYPMPTIALLNGHAFAGGIMLSFFHDYRIMNPSRGFACLNELDLGVPLKPAMSSIFRQKLSPSVYKTMVLEAYRYSGKTALESGIVDALGGLEETLTFVKERKLTEKGKSGVYGHLKAEMYRETIGYLEGHEREERRDEVSWKKENERKEEGRRRVEQWERQSVKPKL